MLGGQAARQIAQRGNRAGAQLERAFVGQERIATATARDLLEHGKCPRHQRDVGGQHGRQIGLGEIREIAADIVDNAIKGLVRHRLALVAPAAQPQRANVAAILDDSLLGKALDQGRSCRCRPIPARG